MYKALFVNEQNEEFEVMVSGESVESVADYLCNCGDYDDCLLLSVVEEATRV